MAMYIKPLVTGKEAKLIPDEISGFFLKSNNSTRNTDEIEKNYPINNDIQNYSLPSIKSINPNETKPNSLSRIEIEGDNFKESMKIMVFSDSQNKSINTTLEGDKLIGNNVFLSEGNWIVKIYDPELNNTYNTKHIINVVPTPTPGPTWDGNPKPLDIREKIESKSWGRSYPSDSNVTSSIMNTYVNFSGVTGVISNPISIPYGFWDIIYTVEFRTEIANPNDDKVFEFNRQYKEPLVSYEGNFTLLYLSGNPIPILVPSKTRVENKSLFKPSKDIVLTKIPKDESPNANPPFEIETTEYLPGTLPALVEAVGYNKPFFKIVLHNLDNHNEPPIVITPNGGIDPLQWDEKVHKKEAEKIMTQKGKKAYFDSIEYQDAWEEKWKYIKDPRPWKERIYGSGNYSFEIFTQSIDSYNIQILVPEAIWIQNKLDEDDIYKDENKKIRLMVNSFVDDFNAILSPDYLNNLSEYIDTNNYSSNELKILKEDYMQTRAAGILIKETIFNDISIRGYRDKTNKLIQSTGAIIKGNFIIDYDNYEKYVPFDIEMEKINNNWKFVNSPVIRY